MRGQSSETTAVSKLKGMVVGSPIDIELQTPTTGIRLKAKLVGIDEPHVLIIKPVQDANWVNAKSFIKFGQPLVVRIVNESNYCDLIAFRSQFNLLVGNPRHWLTIDYPVRVQTVTLRKQRRLPVKFDALLVWECDSRMLSMDAHLNDLSLSGCGLSTQLTEPLKEGSEIILTLFSEPKPIQDIVGVVRSCQKQGKDDLYHVGIQFSPDDSGSKEKLTNLLLDSF